MLDVSQLSKSYRQAGTMLTRSRSQVLQSISLSLATGEWAALVGESGSGKSTVGRLLLGLELPDQGSVLIEGMEADEWRRTNKGQMSVVFQDYKSSVNPAFQVKDIIKEPMQLRQTGDETVESLLEKVELPLTTANRYPHELSGGQLQRVCIARAISTRPKFIVMDEALRSLDVSVQAQILQLLFQLKQDLQSTCLFITHDLQTVANLCDTVLFLNNGHIVERIAANQLMNVQNNYAKQLLASVIRFNV